MDDVTPQVSKSELDNALLDIHLRNRWHTAAISAVALFLCYFLLYSSLEGPALNLWLAAGVVSLAMRALSIVLSRTSEQARKQIKLHYLLIALAGAVWGGLVFLWSPTLGLFEQLVIVLFPLAITIGAVTAYGAWLPSLYFFSVPALSPVVVMFLASGSSDIMKIAIPAAFCIVVQTLLANAYHGQLRSSLKLKLTNERLVDNLSQHNAELLEARDQAKSAGVAKNEFLARMSHEIRTPINGVLGMAEVLKKTELDSEQRSAVATLRSSGSKLLNLINELLDVSTLESGSHELNKRDFELHALLGETLKQQQDAADAKNLVLDLDITAQVPYMINGDAHRLQQILSNVVGNAIKFSKQGQVLLRADVVISDEARKCIRYTVKDNGVGIEDDRQQRIFDVFQQGDGSITRRYGGSGLGLSIAKSFTELMDGRISVESQAGRGSTFTIDIPLTLASRQSMDSALSESDSEEDETELQSLPARVLVAEDNPINQTVISAMLESFDCDVTVVDNGEEALNAIAESEFDMVFMDCQMPVMDGLSATQIARERGERLPIVAVTANVMKGDREICLAAGMNDYVSKPLDSERLHFMLSHWVFGQGCRSAVA